ncbi:MAG TPA: ribosome silencing factor [Acidimicrobiia bacterium]
MTDLDPSRDRARLIADAADSKKGEDIVVLDVGDIMSLAEIFVIVSAPNTRLVRTLVDTIDERMREEGAARPRTVEGLDSATWVLLDYGDVVVHVFLDETREFYSLERLWADAPRIAWSPAGT